MDDLLFGKINIPVLDKERAAKEVLSIPDAYSWWDEYRGIKMIPLMSKNGKGTTNYRDGDFLWTPYTPKLIVDWFEDVVFDWLGSKSRIMALITEANAQNREHIDCERSELNTKQHKFRIVLQGRTDTLYFKTDRGDVFAPKVDSAFIMDGGWPHGMINRSPETKVTIALGAPWNGKEVYDDVDVLMNRNKYSMPADLNAFWKQN